MNISIVKMRFNRPIHISKGKVDTYESSDNIIRSDTIHAALFVSALQLYGVEEAHIIKDEVTVSSAFPFTGEIYWLPRPKSFQPDNMEHRKYLKKKKFVTIDQFKKIAQGGNVQIEDLLKWKDPEVWKSEITQRVLIDRVNHRSMPFYLERMFPLSKYDDSPGRSYNQISFPFHKEMGLYFIMASTNEISWIEYVIKFLGENGIGLQKNLGNGTFEYEIIKNNSVIYFDSIGDSKYWINLSLFRPTYEDVNSSTFRLDRSYYSLIKRGGWIANPSNTKFLSLRKKSLMMFEEGSVFFIEGKSKSNGVVVYGDVLNVRPDWNDIELHPVWRSGRSIMLPIQIHS